jgi:Tol biopolymer transport system component
MKQLSLWFAFFSCAVLASLLPVSCTKENGALDPLSMSNKTSMAVNKPSPPPPPPADPAIAYVAQGINGVSNLMVMNADGSNQTVIYTGTGIWFPSWSPGGTKIEFGMNSGLWIVGISVVNRKPIGSTPFQIPGSGQFGSPNSGGKWSPDGNWIAFTVLGQDAQMSNIYLISATPTGGTPIVAYTSQSGLFPFDPDWSYDSKKLVFDEEQMNSPYYSDLKIVDVSGSLPSTNVTTILPLSSLFINTPDWSRNGDHRIAFSDNISIYTVVDNLTSQTPVKVTGGRYPTWSPNNLELAYRSFAKNTVTITTYNFSTHATTSLGSGTWPDWKR